MIRVTVTPCSIELNGHADYGSYGQDIVCAAASMLVHTLAKWLQERIGGAEIYLESGNALIRSEAPQAAEAFRFTVCGLKLLAQSYPDKIIIDDSSP